MRRLFSGFTRGLASQFARLHRDRGGQVVILFMLGMMTLVVSVAMVLNTGRMVHNRTRAQNAADAAAMSQASWLARGLNVVSMNNVGMTHAFTITMVSQAYTTVVLDAGKVALDKLNESNKWANALSGIPVVGGALAAPYRAYSVVMGAIIAQFAAIELRFAATTHAMPTGYRLIDGFNRMSDHVVNEFPRYSWAMTEAMRQQNGVDQIRLHPMSPDGTNNAARRGTEMPAAGGVLGFAPFGPMKELCTAAEEGVGSGSIVSGGGDERINFTKHGYTRGEGPFTRSKEDPGWILTSTRLTDQLPIPLDLPFPVLPGPLYNMWNQYSTVPPSSPFFLTPPALIWMDLDQDWTTTPFPTLPPFLPPTPIPPFILPPKGYFGFINDVQQPQFDGVLGINAWSNDYADKMRDDWDGACGLLPTGTVLLAQPRLYKLDPPSLLCKGLSFVAGLQGSSASSKSCMRDALSLMAFSVLEEEPLSVPDRFENPPGASYAYAQAGVYNLLSYDLYTQAWGARLEPARWMEGQGGQISAIQSELQNESRFAALADFLQRASANDVGTINAH